MSECVPSAVWKCYSCDTDTLRLKRTPVIVSGQFLIDPKGIVRQMTVNDLPVGRSVDESLRLLKVYAVGRWHPLPCYCSAYITLSFAILHASFISHSQAFQFTDKHGEVCPANWKEGAATMKPDPTGSQEYFKKSVK